MKRYIKAVLLICISVSAAYAANADSKKDVQMVSYFPVPYAAYNDLNVSSELQTNLGQQSALELGSANMSPDNASLDVSAGASVAAHQGTANVNVNTLHELKSDNAIIGGGANDNSAADFNKLQVGQVEGNANRHVGAENLLTPEVRFAGKKLPFCYDDKGKLQTAQWQKVQVTEGQWKWVLACTGTYISYKDLCETKKNGYWDGTKCTCFPNAKPADWMAITSPTSDCASGCGFRTRTVTCKNESKSAMHTPQWDVSDWSVAQGCAEKPSASQTCTGNTCGYQERSVTCNNGQWEVGQWAPECTPNPGGDKNVISCAGTGTYSYTCDSATWTWTPDYSGCGCNDMNSTACSAKCERTLACNVVTGEYEAGNWNITTATETADCSAIDSKYRAGTNATRSCTCSEDVWGQWDTSACEEIPECELHPETCCSDLTEQKACTEFGEGYSSGYAYRDTKTCQDPSFNEIGEWDKSGCGSPCDPQYGSCSANCGEYSLGGNAAVKTCSVSAGGAKTYADQWDCSACYKEVENTGDCYQYGARGHWSMISYSSSEMAKRICSMKNDSGAKYCNCTCESGCDQTNACLIKPYWGMKASWRDCSYSGSSVMKIGPVDRSRWHCEAEGNIGFVLGGNVAKQTCKQYSGSTALQDCGKWDICACYQKGTQEKDCADVLGVKAQGKASRKGDVYACNDETDWSKWDTSKCVRCEQTNTYGSWQQVATVDYSIAPYMSGNYEWTVNGHYGVKACVGYSAVFGNGRALHVDKDGWDVAAWAMNCERDAGGYSGDFDFESGNKGKTDLTGEECWDYGRRTAIVTNANCAGGSDYGTFFLTSAKFYCSSCYNGPSSCWTGDPTGGDPTYALGCTPQAGATGTVKVYECVQKTETVDICEEASSNTGTNTGSSTNTGSNTGSNTNTGGSGGSNIRPDTLLPVCNNLDGDLRCLRADNIIGDNADGNGTKMKRELSRN